MTANQNKINHKKQANSKNIHFRATYTKEKNFEPPEILESISTLCCPIMVALIIIRVENYIHCILFTKLKEIQKLKKDLR